MKKAIYSFIYYRLLGWKTNVTVPNYDKCVICAAPHTTNLDLFIGKLFYGAIGRKTSFMMKKEWFFFPLGVFFKAVGGIPVNRSRKTSLVDQMVHNFAKYKKFNFNKLFSVKKRNKNEVVTAFSGLLEMSRRNKVITEQEEIFGDIEVEKNKKV